MMTQCANHLYYQLPKILTRVNFMIYAIEYKDPGLNVDIAIVKVDTRPNGKMNKFEYESACLTP